MCSRHVLPTVGSNVTVHITRVNLQPHCAFVEFGGNFNHGQLTREIYQQMRKEIQIYKEQNYCFEGSPGDVCLVEEEKIWHRARILSRCADEYLVLLIDVGRTLWASKRFLAWGQSSFFNLPPMMELFIMASVSPLSLENRWSPTASEFLKSLSGKTVCGCVQDVMMPYRIIILDIPTVFKQMQEFGFAKKIPSEEFQILVMNSLHSQKESVSCARPHPALTNFQTEHANDLEKVNQYLYPELLPGTIEAVEVTQVINPLCIFCKLHVFSHELKKLSEQIQEYCESNSAAVMSRPSDGSPCATKGSDGKWYRSILQQNVGFDFAKVFHVDYGIADFVKMGDIRPLSVKFFRLPVVTYKCSLYGIKDKGFGWTTAQIEHLKSVLLNQIFVGKFEYQNLSGGIYYVTLHGNDHVNINNSFAAQENCLLAPDRAWFDSPSEIQSQETHKNFHEHRYATPVHSLGSCIVPHDLLPPENSKVYGLPRTELSTTGDSPAERIYRSLPTDLYPCNVESVLDEHLFTVGTVIEVNVSHVENDQRFWCQMAGSLSGLKMLMEDIQRCYSCSQFQLSTGSRICVAHHPDDGMWYRAQIVNHYLTPHADVRLIDYGQLLKVPLQRLRPIEPQFLKLKCQAFQCSLSNKMHSGSCEGTALSDSGLSDSFDFISPVSFCKVSLKCTVNAIMYDSQGAVLNIVDVESLAPNLCTAFVPKEANISAVESLESPCVLDDVHAISIHSINVGAEEQVWITCVKGVNHFCGQIKQNTDLVAKLNKGIQQYCAVAEQTRYSFSPEMMCVARYNDGQWYRGQIKAVKPNIIVHFVDYGDVLALDESDVLPFPAEQCAYMSIPFQAVQFRLFNVTLQESSELNTWFENHAIDCTFTATVMGKSRTGKLSVELHDGQTNINLKVKEKWKEIQKKEHNPKRVANKMSPKFTEPLWRRDHSNSRLEALQDCRNTWKSADPSSFTGKEVEKVQCTDFATGPFISQKAEKQTDLDKPVVSICSKLKDLPSRIIEAGFVSEVYVSHCISPSSFFVQLASEESEICSLVDELNCSKFCESLVDFNQFLPGHLIKAAFPYDGAWYRAVVKNKLNDCTIHVEFFDYGNETNLSVLNVRQLGLQFLKYPRYSIHCCLTVGDGEGKREWTTEQAELFKKATVTNGEKKLLCTFIKEKASVWQVSIKDQGVMLAESLLDMEYAVKSSCDTPMTVNSGDVCPGIYKKPEVSVGQRIEAYASSIAGPNYFWCQYAAFEKLDQISVIAQESGNSAPTHLIQLHHLSPGDSCLALFPDDNMWYRAQVINKCESSVSVLFIDYGNESEVHPTSVKAVPISLLEAPPQAFLCQLEGFKPTDGYWNDTAAGRFSALVADKLLTVSVQNVDITSDVSNCPQYNVQVECSMGLINGLMKDYWIGCTTEVCGQITKEVSLKPMVMSLSGSGPSTQCFPKVTDLPPTAIGQDFVSEVYVSHINNPSSFFVQLAKDENDLISLTEELNSTFLSVSDQIETNSVSHGSLVKAVFPDDDSWYRAVIKGTNEKDVHIEFVDFGNEATVPVINVCKLDEQFLKFPRFSIHCCLNADDHVSIQLGTEQGTSPLINVSGKDGEKRLFCKFIKELRTVWEVKIADEKSALDGSCKDLPLEKWEDLDISRLENASPKQVLSEVIQIETTDVFSLPFKRPVISVGQTVEVYASYIAGPDYFWCQHANSEELGKISVIAQETGNSAQTDLLQIERLCPGDTCIARFTDEMWYRAQVIKKSPNTFYVLFVDFGNEFEVEVDSMKPLPLSLLESPLQAFLCQLEGFSLSDGSWNDNATDKFCELIVDKPLKVTVKKLHNVLDSPSPSHHVKVHSKECVVNEQMKSFWSACTRAFETNSQNPRLIANSVQLLSNGQSAPGNRVDVIPDNSLENIRTSDMKPQCNSPFENEETFKQNDELHEEPVKNEVKVEERHASATDLDAVSGDAPCLTLENVSESKEEFSGTGDKCYQTSQLTNDGPDQEGVKEINSTVPATQADLGYKPELDEFFQWRDW
ncbi:tudor domain-containing 6 isoform X2 [Pygocentrus nattereri]|uniref:tudor domain-containing 6 isoform X2 n=1 Tax=Pygocentrus nattereri TaxID=42514 RepID=UPI0008144D02|nr:tudor domain-containing 6 isoform X2 [Pygocentrus nattereri]